MRSNAIVYCRELFRWCSQRAHIWVNKGQAESENAAVFCHSIAYPLFFWLCMRCGQHRNEALPKLARAFTFAEN